MKFTEIDWADSNIEKIQIEYDRATLVIWNDTLKRTLEVICSGLAGITDVCLWDDTIIVATNVSKASEENAFLKELYTHYDKHIDYGGRDLNKDFLEVIFTLCNDTSFKIYCQTLQIKEVEVSEDLIRRKTSLKDKRSRPPVFSWEE